MCLQKCKRMNFLVLVGNGYRQQLRKPWAVVEQNRCGLGRRGNESSSEMPFPFLARIAFPTHVTCLKSHLFSDSKICFYCLHLGRHVCYPGMNMVNYRRSLLLANRIRFEVRNLIKWSCLSVVAWAASFWFCLLVFSRGASRWGFAWPWFAKPHGVLLPSPRAVLSFLGLGRGVW